jgi:hypothetical protein
VRLVEGNGTLGMRDVDLDAEVEGELVTSPIPQVGCEYAGLIVSIEVILARHSERAHTYMTITIIKQCHDLPWDVASPPPLHHAPVT